MNLKLILPIKKIRINDKCINIPKLGLKHHELLKNPCSPDESIKKLLNSIDPNLTLVEGDIVIIHLLEFNNKLNEKINVDGMEMSIDDIYPSQVLTHQYQGYRFRFRSPTRSEHFTTADDVLKKCFVEVEGSDIIPDFMDMPAFVSKWADSITNTVSINGPNGPIHGLNNIIGLFE